MRKTRAPREITAGKEFGGFITGSTIFAMLIALFFGAGTFLVGLMLHVPIMLTFIAGLTFPILTFIYLLMFVVNRPPGYQFDFFASVFGANKLSVPKKRRVYWR